jgi:hypothetical protein
MKRAISIEAWEAGRHMPGNNLKECNRRHNGQPECRRFIFDALPVLELFVEADGDLASLPGSSKISRAAQGRDVEFVDSPSGSWALFWAHVGR